MPRIRAREAGINLGWMETGENNTITDVPGVQVGHSSLISDHPRAARTGVTVILPRGVDSWRNWCFAGTHTLNGNGEMTGIHWIWETGLLCGPVALTNTYQVGMVRDAILKYAKAKKKPYEGGTDLPVVAETWDGWLNDIWSFNLKETHLFEAFDNAKGGKVQEGNVGGGTGMICHEFKGGIGTTSRRIEFGGEEYILGALVQANYGLRRLFRVGGIPVGSIIGELDPPLPWPSPISSSSIIVILATNAPLLPGQCRRLAQRASLGVGRMGGMGSHSSGDIFLCFSTANDISDKAEGIISVEMFPQDQLTPFFEAVVELTEEAILNALCMAETMEGFEGHVAHEMPIERLMNAITDNRRD